MCVFAACEHDALHNLARCVSACKRRCEEEEGENGEGVCVQPTCNPFGSVLMSGLLFV